MFYLDGSVVGVNHELGEGTGLGGSVPAIRAVDQDTHTPSQALRDEERGLQHRLHTPVNISHFTEINLETGIWWKIDYSLNIYPQGLNWNLVDSFLFLSNFIK